jgi:CHAD domain-containing protein
LGHRIGRREAIDQALWRLIFDDLAAARAGLQRNGPREERIHRTRQRLKRTRSLLAVVRPALGDAAQNASKALAGAARLLAGARDADAAAASARGLRAVVPVGEDAGLDRIVAELDQKAAEAHQRAAPVGEVRDRLAAVEADFAKIQRPVDGAGLLERALARAYRKGRHAMRQAETSLATPDLHRWRKAVKDLWHLLKLARKRLPRKARSQVEGLARLGELLGLDHDHAVLAERLALSPTGDPALMRQLSLIARERRNLEAGAFKLGRRLYRKTPRRFEGRMRLD